MLIEESKFRRLLKTEYGGFEGERFQSALDNDPAGDTIIVTFGSELTKDLKSIKMKRSDVQRYAQIAKEERKPELDLIEHIKPRMRTWILMNRRKMCDKLKKSLSDYSPEHHNGVTIVWPTETPDKVDHDLVKKYIEAYE